MVAEGNCREVDSGGDLQLPSWKAIFPGANGLFVIQLKAPYLGYTELQSTGRPQGFRDAYDHRLP